MIIEHGIFHVVPGSVALVRDDGLDWMAYANGRCEFGPGGVALELPGTYFAAVRSDGVVASVAKDPTALTPYDCLVVETDQEVVMLQRYEDDSFLPALPAPIVVYPADLWRRASEEEAEAIEAAMTTQPAKFRNLFRSASTYRSDDQLWPMLMGAATELFGAARAMELLAAS